MWYKVPKILNILSLLTLKTTVSSKYYSYLILLIRKSFRGTTVNLKGYTDSKRQIDFPNKTF